MGWKGMVGSRRLGGADFAALAALEGCEVWPGLGGASWSFRFLFLAMVWYYS